MTARDSALAALRGHVEDLAEALAAWEARDDTRPQADARRAASLAVAAADRAISELYGLRAVLHGEIRISDDMALTRQAELLRRIQKDGGPPARA